MATFWATHNIVDNRSKTTTLPVMRGVDAEGLRPITTSGTSQTVQRGGADWTCPNHGYLTIRCDGAVWIHIDASPTAVKGVAGATDPVDWYIPANETWDFSVEPGDKLAVIDA